MKKAIALILGIMMMATMVVMTGCTKQTTVEFTVEGIDAVAVLSATSQKIDAYSRQEDINGIEPTKYSIAFKSDGDYSMLLVDKNNATYPFVLKIHNGKVEAETPEGVTVNLTIK